MIRSASIALPRRFFLKPRLVRPPRQRRFHLRQRNLARLKHHQQVVDEIGGFGDQPVTILGRRGERGLHALLAELLGAMGDALVEQCARIGDLGARLRALVQGERGQGGLPTRKMARVRGSRTLGPLGPLTNRRFRLVERFAAQYLSITHAQTRLGILATA